jgi:hypothetical protein
LDSPHIESTLTRYEKGNVAAFCSNSNPHFWLFWTPEDSPQFSSQRFCARKSIRHTPRNYPLHLDQETMYAVAAALAATRQDVTLAGNARRGRFQHAARQGRAANVPGVPRAIVNLSFVDTDGKRSLLSFLSYCIVTPPLSPSRFCFCLLSFAVVLEVGPLNRHFSCGSCSKTSGAISAGTMTTTPASYSKMAFALRRSAGSRVPMESSS